MNRKPVFTTFEAAKLCHVSPLSIINWVNADRLPAFRTPGGHRRIRREDLAQFMRDNGRPMPDELKQGSGRRRVLIVEDSSSTREALAEHLSSRPQPFEVVTASDGFEAGRLVGTFRPDVVLLDLRMSGLDGFQVCRTIKTDPATANTMVISMMGYRSPEAESRILECGAARCFAKPVDPTAISAFIESEFDDRRKLKPRRGRARN